LRLFIALLLSEEVQDEVMGATAALRDSQLPVRWVGREALHLTLKFLGDCPRRTLPELERAVADAAAKTPPFDLHIGGLGAFPSLRNPRTLWLGVEATPPLRCLKQDIEWALSPLGFERETRAFQPHLTIGRAESKAQAGDFRELEGFLQSLDYEAKIEVSDVHLVRSHLSPSGAKYERIATLPLG